MKNLRKRLEQFFLCTALGACITVSLCWLVATAVPLAPNSGTWLEVDNFPHRTWETSPPIELTTPSSRTKDSIPSRSRIARSWKRLMIVDTNEVVTETELAKRMHDCAETTRLLLVEAAHTNPGEPIPELPNCSYNVTSVTYFMVDEAYGWPLLAMQTTRAGATSPYKVASPFQVSSLTEGLEHPLPRTWSRSGSWSTLPLKPVWRGFLTNTIFWGVCIAAIGFSWSFIKRAWRSRRGVCVQCCYALRGLQVCPECGTPSPIQPATSQSTP
jgi:hypothetical protein